MKKIKLSIKSFKPMGLDDKPIDLGEGNDLNKAVANTIYFQVTDIGLLDIARAIYKNKTVEATVEQVEFIRSFIEKDNQLLAWIRASLLDWLSELIEGGRKNSSVPTKES